MFLKTYSDYKLIIESLNTAKKKYLDRGLISNDVFQSLVSLDPSTSKKYLDSLCRFHLERDVTEGELEQLIIKYNELASKKLIKELDINKFKTYREFKNYVLQNDTLVSNREADKIKKTDGSEVVYEDENYLVILIKRHDACILYGSGTKWCITQQDGKHWKHYNRFTTFYFILDKKRKPNDKLYKVAVQVNKSGFLFWNANDFSLNLEEYKKLTNIPDKILKYLKFIPIDFTSMSIEEIINFLNIDISKCTINTDKTVDVKDDVILDKIDFSNSGIPIKFGTIVGDFACTRCELTSLNNAPDFVEGSFFCSYNNLKNLEGGPLEVSKHYVCFASQLKSLKGSPKRVGEKFMCSWNDLKTLEGGPKFVYGMYECQGNNIEDFVGIPETLYDDFNGLEQKATLLTPKELIFIDKNNSKSYIKHDRSDVLKYTKLNKLSIKILV